MYKDPQLSAKARQLRDELAKFSAPLSHTQALEVVARLDGDQTLHVAQARKNAGVRIADVAKAQAEALMFDSLGAFEGKIDALIEQLKLLSKLRDAHEVDNLFTSIFRGQQCPKLSQSFRSLSADDIPVEFEKLVAKLQAVLIKQAKALANQEASPLYEGPMLDWTAAQGENLSKLSEEQRTARFVVTVQREGHQFYVDIVPPHQQPDEIEGKAQMTLFVEVNQGLPCVHISNDRYGGQVLTVFATQDGLYLRPDAGDLRICTGVPDEKRQPGLSAMHKLETEPPFGSRATWNHAFIVTKGI